MNFYTYDLETYPNVFTCAVKRRDDGARWLFEISDRKDDRAQLWAFLQALHNDPNCAMVGFNSIGFDYPILHDFIKSNGTLGCFQLYEKAQAIIDSNDQFAHTVWESDWYIPQLDLYKIHHFDNAARRTGLKQIEFNMRVTDLMDLPFTPGTRLTSDEIDQLIKYNMEGDVENTEAFLEETLPAIEFRQRLTAEYGRSFMNDNDTKVGKQYFIMELEKSGVPCYTKQPGAGKVPIQTPRAHIALKDAILPWIEFDHPELTRVLEWFKAQTITETKGVFKDISATIDGFTFDFGLGGVHGAADAGTFRSDENYAVALKDVTSYYPTLAIVNKFRPEHLGERFCEIYQDMYEQRKGFAKGTPENAVMKLALNGTYGDSNNPYSPFYDPLFTMKITLNGQLLLCLLSERLMQVSGLQMLNCNTDGICYRYPRECEDQIESICDEWMRITGLELETDYYSMFAARDCNNYIAVFEE